MSFLISTPQTGIDSIMVTYSLLGLPMAIVKPVIVLFTGFLGGFLTNITGGRSKGKSIDDSDSNGGDAKRDRSLKGMLRYAFVEFLEDIAKWLVIGLLIGALFFGFLVNEALPRQWFTMAVQSVHSGAHAHEILPGWLKLASSLLLSGLVINALIRKYVPFRRRTSGQNKRNGQKSDLTKVVVKGMHCNHCKTAVESAVASVPGVVSVEADVANETAVIRGEDFDLQKVKIKIEDHGYEFGGILE